MFSKIMQVFFGTKAERDIKKLQPLIDAVNGLESEMKAMSDEALQGQTDVLKQELREKLGVDPKEIPLKGIENEKNRLRLREALDAILPRAFAVVREAAWRIIKQRHYDVQLIGGMVLHQGKIAEMKTGEGKTLAATLAVYLNGLTGRGVHIVTVNDYLAQRDAEWMGPIYRFLGLSTGFILTSMDPSERQEAYGADITYGTNNEFGFDYLRDNMVPDKSLKVQGDYYFCIVDEVDSILIDEARTPLIISGAAESSTQKYTEIQRIIPRLKPDQTVGQSIDSELEKLDLRKNELTTKLEKVSDEQKKTIEEELDQIRRKMKELSREKQNAAINKEVNNPQGEGDFIVEEEDKSLFLTPEGIKRVEDLLNLDNLYSDKNIELVHHIEQALKANVLFKRDVDYVVKDGEVIIVDEFTGRLMPGRRYSDGLHQALEAKERVHVAKENQTLATITFQNYFRMYAKLSGMTGTADTEAEEFKNIYNLDVVVIPTNKPIIRKDFSDRIYRTEGEKFYAIADEIAELHKEGQPVLVGTISVEKSEHLATLLKNRGIPHNVLNAKFHGKEAEIVAQAGQVGKVTIATNMAGRGTDIVLGGNPEFEGRQLVEKLLSHKQIHADPEKVTDYIRLIGMEKEELLKTFMTENNEFSHELADKVRNVYQQGREKHNKVLELGGLHILGTERHEARRIDNQLRGRGGRQGDPGSSRFYISMEDDLMRVFGGERMKNAMHRLGLKEGEEIEHPLISRAIANSQKRVENRNFEIRKHLLKYDEVMDEQRNYIYSLRDRVLEEETIDSLVDEFITEVVDAKLDEYSGGRRSLSEESVEDLSRWIENDLRIKVDFSEVGDIAKVDYETVRSTLIDALKGILEDRKKQMGEKNMRMLKKVLLLDTIDTRWKEHLYEMDYLKEGINWRAYAERDPLVEYKSEGFALFHSMLERVREDVLPLIFHAELTQTEQQADFDEYFMGDAMHDEYGQFGMLTPQEQQMLAEQQQMAASGGGGAPVPRQPGRKPSGQRHTREEKVGRNQPCPCGSGKKYKHCCYPKYGK